jgi:hypothetical protein
MNIIVVGVESIQKKKNDAMSLWMMTIYSLCDGWKCDVKKNDSISVD